MAGMRISRATVEDIERLKQYLKKRDGAPHRWQVVLWNADLIMEDCADPTENHLCRSPYLFEQHVANEQ